jgi:hypothetical protein
MQCYTSVTVACCSLLDKALLSCSPAAKVPCQLLSLPMPAQMLIASNGGFKC